MGNPAIKFLVFDSESVADGGLVSRVRYPGQGLSPTEAVARYRAELVETSWSAALDAIGRDFQPLTDHRASSGYRARVARNILYKSLLEIAGADCAETRVTGRRESAVAV